jgi:integrase
MASAWIISRTTPGGEKRYHVRYRLGGRESATRYGGSFKTKREAAERRGWIAGELAARQVPDLRSLEIAVPQAPTLAEACDRWRASRVDVSEGTRTLHRVALGRVTPILGSVRVDELTVDHANRLVAELHASGRKRETIKKSVKYLAAVLDENGRNLDNPARSKRIRLPHEEQIEIEPPDADTVEAAFWLLPKVHRLPLLWLDWSGARVSSVETTRISDYDEPRRRVRLRAAATKTRTPLWVELPDTLADALERSLPPREDRDPEAQLFTGANADALRTAIGRACRAAGVPGFSPHDLRHRRISLLHRQGRTWAEIGRFVGQRKLSVTADTYTHVLIDGRELDYAALVSSRQNART